MNRLEQAEAAQVFLPYAYDQQAGKTLYEKVQSGEMKLIGEQTINVD